VRKEANINTYYVNYKQTFIRRDQIAAIQFNIDEESEHYVNNAQVYLVNGGKIVLYGTAGELGELALAFSSSVVGNKGSI